MYQIWETNIQNNDESSSLSLQYFNTVRAIQRTETEFGEIRNLPLRIFFDRNFIQLSRSNTTCRIPKFNISFYLKIVQENYKQTYTDRRNRRQRRYEQKIDQREYSLLFYISNKYYQLKRGNIYFDLVHATWKRISRYLLRKSRSKLRIKEIYNSITVIPVVPDKNKHATCHLEKVEMFWITSSQIHCVQSLGDRSSTFLVKSVMRCCEDRRHGSAVENTHN